MKFEFSKTFLKSFKRRTRMKCNFEARKNKENRSLEFHVNVGTEERDQRIEEK